MADPLPENQEAMTGIATSEDLEMPLSTSDAAITNGHELVEPAERPATSIAIDAAPMKVFSLFLSPEERRLKMEREAAAAREAAASKATRSASSTDGTKRGKKVKKVVHNIFVPGGLATTASTTTTATSSAPSETAASNGSRKPATTKLSAHVPGTGDPSLAPHPFFTEINKEARAAGQATDVEQAGTFVPRYRWSLDRQPAPYPSDRCHFHGAITRRQSHVLIGEMYDLLASLPDRCENSRRSHKDFGWYALRTLDDSCRLGADEPPSTEAWIGRAEPKWTTKSGLHRDRQRTRGTRGAQRLSAFQRADNFASCHRFTDMLATPSGPQLLLAEKGESSSTDQRRIEGKPGDLWIDKYRPRSGADVLGNRPSTEYLTRWLKGLEVSAWSLGHDDLHHPTNGHVSSKRSISGIGRPKKRTRRNKTRGDDDLSDFIVDDDFGDDDYGGSDADQGDESFAPHPNISPFARYSSQEYCIGDTAQPKKLDGNVEVRSNIILLSGPSGSGKTAAVYACAEEMGYEVFEVSPGSKRAGRDVLALVGEMAENHHVHVVSNGTGTNSANNSTPNTPSSSTSVNGEISSKRSKESEMSRTATTDIDKPQQPSVYNLFFKKFKPKRLDEDLVPEEKEPQAEPLAEASTKDEEGKDEAGKEEKSKEERHDKEETTEEVKSGDVKESPEEEEEIDVVEDTPLAVHQDSLSDYLSLLTTTNPRQSLILLEEVDILFEDDKGFWGSIATLAAKSKRPIVMTCNDPMLIPPGILKIQEHLRFERPCTSELFRYLECVSRMEGHVYTPGTLEDLIEEGQRDTRRVMMQLQLSASAPSKEDSPKDQQPVSRPLGSSGVRKGPQRLFRITSKGYFENDQEEPLKDDEQGVRFLFKEPTSDDHLSRDLEIAELVEEGARAIFGNQTNTTGVERSGLSAIAECACVHTTDMNKYYTQPSSDQSRYVSKLAPAFERLLPVQILCHQHRNVFSIYASAVRDIVHADNLNITIPSGRRSMRSNGGFPRRHLHLYPAECSAFSSTAFDEPDDE
ncbi:hypothetical protein DFQ26_002055 [Actinomortierella ambigua]|nr:hypothetical protein DFQ26_002055 [Actinomortierella ambigua]